MRQLLIITADYLRTLMHRGFLIALLICVLVISLIFYLIIDVYANDPALRSQIWDVLAAFYAGTSLCGSLAAIYLGVSVIWGELSRGTIAMILSRPVKRWQLLLGKYVGALTVLLLFSLAMGGIMAVYVSIHDLDMSPAMRYAPWLTFCQLLLMCSIALALSSVMHPLIAGVLAMLSDISWLFEYFVTVGPYHYVSYVLPSYGLFNVWIQFRTTATLYGWAEVGMLTLYALDVSLIMVLLAVWRLHFKEIN